MNRLATQGVVTKGKGEIMDILQSTLGGILGLCVGDALGVPVEFQSRESLKRNPVTGMRGHGTHNQLPGTWSDDSSLTLCLLESLCAGYDLRDAARQFIGWMGEAHWTAHGEVFDVGNTTREAVFALGRVANPVDAGGRDQYSNGNGSLMRILPLALATSEMAFEERSARTCEVSSLTHGHPRSLLACVIYVEVAVELLHGRFASDAVAAAIARVEPLAHAKRHGWDEELLAFHSILRTDLQTRPEGEVPSSGYVVHTLLASLWCLLNTRGYSEAVLKAVNLGGDTHTTGAVTGGLAGILYGIEAIPAEWLATLARRADIEALCRRFAERYTNA